MFNATLIIYASLLPIRFEGSEKGVWGRNCQKRHSYTVYIPDTFVVVLSVQIVIFRTKIYKNSSSTKQIISADVANITEILISLL